MKGIHHRDRLGQLLGGGGLEPDEPIHRDNLNPITPGLVLATLSFLGMGVVPPTPSWGGMLAEAANNSIYLIAPWLVLIPGLTLLLTTLAFNLLGDGLRDALDPRSVQSR